MDDDKNPQSQDIRESAQQIFLAGLGALKKAEEEGSKVFQKLATKGRSYDGPAAEQFQAALNEFEERLASLSARASEGMNAAERQSQKMSEVFKEQIALMRGGLGNALTGVEARIEKTVAAALENLEIPTKADFEELREAVRSLGNAGATSDQSIDYREADGGTFEVRVGNVVVDTVLTEIDARKRVEEIRSQNAPSSGPGEITVEPTGGGWYEVKLDGKVVDKVQGSRAADAVVARIKKQG